MNKQFIMFSLISIMFISGCITSTGKTIGTTKYVCPDGITIVADILLCPKEEARLSLNKLVEVSTTKLNNAYPDVVLSLEELKERGKITSGEEKELLKMGLKDLATLEWDTVSLILIEGYNEESLKDLVEIWVKQFTSVTTETRTIDNQLISIYQDTNEEVLYSWTKDKFGIVIGTSQPIHADKLAEKIISLYS